MLDALPLAALLACTNDEDPDDAAPVVPMIDVAMTAWCDEYAPGAGVTPGEDLWRVALDDPAAVCNDGTPAVMYIRPASSPEFEDDWVFYLQGGSACTDLETCAVRWCGTGQYTKAKMSSAWTAPSARESPLLARDGVNPFGNPNQVLLYYCSSDQWVGTRADTVLTDPEGYPGESYRLHFRGHEIVRAAVERLLAGPVTADENSGVTVPSLADASGVLLTGSSAGARGAEMHADWLADLLAPNGTEVAAWFDANLPIVHEDLGEDAAPVLEAFDRDVRWPEVYEDRYGMFLDASCAAYHDATERWRCGYSEHVVLHHVTTPYFVRQDLADPVIGALYLAQGASVAEMAAAWALTLDRVHEAPATGEEGHLMATAPGVYAPNCGQHVGLNDEAWFSEATVEDDDGALYTHRGAFLTWLAGSGIEVLDGEPSTRSVCAETNDGGG
jgi:hypothetical protein